MRFYILGLSCLFFLACSESGSHSSSTDNLDDLPAFLEGMLPIPASNANVTLGTDNENAKPSERPQMKVEFDYNFYMAKSEVTCGEFDSLMRAETGLVLKCSNDSLPATDISYYDAVLFANAKSKAAGKDTAYTYSKSSFDEEKHCTGLESLVFSPEKEAFRLPTEAEWVFAANKFGKKKNSWTSDNSGYELHPVCAKATKKNELCDIMGNALEFVNDWMGNFCDTTYLNYVGASEGRAIGQRVVKGGSYRDASGAINLYSRGDIYTVTSGTRAEYVGFRLAYGAIPNASWAGDEGTDQTGTMKAVANFTRVRSLVGSFRVKLAFRNEVSGNLVFIDYSNGFSNIMEIKDTIKVYHPEISPDGRRVVFCTGLEGTSSKSQVYVRDLADAGTGLQKLDFENAAIPRWRILPDGDTVIVFVSDAGDNSVDATFKKKSTWQVSFAGEKFGTPQKLFDGAYHGGVSTDGSLAVSGSKLLRARITPFKGSARDTVWYNGEQACNVSLAKDDSHRTLFLDFGSETGRKFVGKSYRVHERILIADKKGKLIKSVASPKGFTFDHTEWVSGLKDYAIVTLVNVNDAHAKIALVNLETSDIVELVQGDELWHPSFWVCPMNAAYYDKLNLDSAGMYYVGQDAPLITHKMNAFWTISDIVEIVALGSSRVSVGFMAQEVKSGYAFNMATIPNDMDVIATLAENYVLPHCKNLKYLIVSLDFDLWSGGKDQNFNKNVGGNIGFEYDKSHSYWKNGVPSQYKELNAVYANGIDYLRDFMNENHGWIYIESGGWIVGGFNENPIIGDPAWSNARVWSKHLDRLKDLIDYAKKKNVVIIGVVFPQSPYYKKTGVFGRHGMLRSTAESLIDSLENWQKKYSNFVFVDENKMGDHDYTDEMAYDYDHLSYAGGQRITRKLDSLIQSMK